MTPNEFNSIVRNEIDNGEKRIAYYCEIDGNIEGDMCYLLKYALGMCYQYNKKNPDADLGVVSYENNEVIVKDKDEILKMLNVENPNALTINEIDEKEFFN